MNQSSFLPLKLNMPGVIPPIFASSIVMFLATAASGSAGRRVPPGDVAAEDQPDALSPGEPLHMILATPG